MTEEPTYRVGDARITCIRDLQLSNFTLGQLIPKWDEEACARRESAPPGTTDVPAEHVFLSVHSWLVRDRGRTILIDTGAGNDKSRPYVPYFDHLYTPFLECLQTEGVAPEHVDLVLLTHLHVDHVGWNTQLRNERWVPTFPNARYVFPRAEHAYFTNSLAETERNRTSLAALQDSVDPVVAAGLADMIESDGKRSRGRLRVPTHARPQHLSRFHRVALGRTARPVSRRRRASSRSGVRTRMNSIFDACPVAARNSRARALGFAADNNAVVFSSHFSASSAGRVQRNGGGFDWMFL